MTTSEGRGEAETAVTRPDVGYERGGGRRAVLRNDGPDHSARNRGATCDEARALDDAVAMQGVLRILCALARGRGGHDAGASSVCRSHVVRASSRQRRRNPTPTPRPRTPTPPRIHAPDRRPGLGLRLGLDAGDRRARGHVGYRRDRRNRPRRDQVLVLEDDPHRAPRRRVLRHAAGAGPQAGLQVYAAPAPPRLLRSAPARPRAHRRTAECRSARSLQGARTWRTPPAQVRSALLQLADRASPRQPPWPLRENGHTHPPTFPPRAPQPPSSVHSYPSARSHKPRRTSAETARNPPCHTTPSPPPMRFFASIQTKARAGAPNRFRCAEACFPQIACSRQRSAVTPRAQGEAFTA